MRVHSFRRSAMFRGVTFSTAFAMFVAPGLSYGETTVAGFTPGSFGVSESGAATYAIPIAVSPGTAGMQPKLSLVYKSQTGNGMLGMGWSLSGLSFIHRCPQTKAQDDTRGGVSHDVNDRFCLDGQRLMLVSTGTYGAAGTEYRTERDSFSKITASATTVSYPSPLTGVMPESFTVKTKAGLTMEYGATGDSRIEAQGTTTIRIWALKNVSDSKGNYLTVSYGNTLSGSSVVADESNANGEFYPAKIEYTGNAGASPYASVQFTYEARTDAPAAFAGGSISKLANRLKTIKTFFGTTLVKDYRIAYEYGTSTGRSRLISITECDGVGALAYCFSPTTIAWQDSGLSLDSAGAAFDVGGSAWASENNRFWVMDVNGDGKADLIRRNLTGSVKVHLGSTNDFDQTATWSFDFSGEAWASEGNRIMFADINGDGRPDLVKRDTSGYLKIHFGSGSAFDTEAITSLNVGIGGDLSEGNRFWFADIDGEGRADLIRRDSVGVLRIHLSTGNDLNGTAVTSLNVGGDPWAGGGNRFWFIDVNGDAKADLIRRDSSGILNVHLSDGSNFSATAIFTLDVGVDAWAGENNRFFFTDVNGDGRPDLIRRDNSGVLQIHYGTGYGFTSATTSYDVGTGTPLSENNRIWFADVNGDGRADLVRRDDSGIVWGHIGNGNGFATSGTNLLAVGSGSYSSENNRYWLEDVNGDGKPDLISRDNFGNLMVRLTLPATASVDYAILITNSLGAMTLLGYKPITDISVYTKESTGSYPVIDIQRPLYVLSSFSTSNGIGADLVTTSYTYGGAKVSLDGRGFLGFHWQEGVDPINLKYRTEFSQAWPYTGMVTLAKRMKSSGAMISQTSNTPACMNPANWPNSCTVASGNRYFPYVYLSEATGNDFTTGAALPAVTASYTNYDVYGNVGTLVVTTVDGSATFTKTTTNYYGNEANGSNWILGRLTKSTVTSVTP